MTHQDVERSDIVDSYLTGRLSAPDRQAFEEHFFACDECFAQMRATDRFAAAVRQASESGLLPPQPDRAIRPSPGWWRQAFAFSLAGLVVLAAVSVRLARQNASQAVLIAQAQRQSADLQAQLSRARRGAEANLPVLILETSRAAGANVLRIPREASRIALWMEIGPQPGAASFRLEIGAGGNQPVTIIDGLAPNPEGALTASIPAEELHPGTYTAKVYAGAKLVADYRLEVQQ